MGLDIEFRKIGIQTVRPDILPIVKYDSEVFVVTPILELRGNHALLDDVRDFYAKLGHAIDLVTSQVLVTQELFEYLKQQHPNIAWDNVEHFFQDDDSRFVLIFWAWW